MNNIHPKKLLHSKWTSMQPVDKELHFVISEVEYDDEGGVLTCSIEAVMSKRQSPIQWQDLKDATRWAQGWQ